MLGRELYPQVSQAEIEGYRMVARLVKLSPEFIIGIAQTGDPLGTLSLIGPDINITVGSRIPLLRSLPGFEDTLVNLGRGGDRKALSVLTDSIKRKYNREVINWKLIHSLAAEVLDPYSGLIALE